MIHSLDETHVRIVGRGYAANLISRLDEQPGLSIERVCREPWTSDGLHRSLADGGFPVQLPAWIMDLGVRQSGLSRLV